MVAFTLRKLVPEAEVVVIEKGPAFISAPSALEYVFGMASWAEITRGYEALTSQGIRLLRAEVQAIDPERRLVRTAAGTLKYTFLVLATGIRLASEEIAGLTENLEANASLYDRSRLVELHRRVEAYQGGTVLLSVPPPPLQCPPAPYEFALLFAERIRQKKFRGKIILLDASTNPAPPSLSRTLEAALFRNQDLIEYVPSARVGALDVGAKKVLTTDREEFPYDLLCLIPPHKAALFIQEAGLSLPGDPFVEVDPFAFRSTKFETIYALGDTARTPYARTASSASVTARICAQQIARALGIQAGSPTSFQSVCYPYVNRREALSLRLDYRLEPGSEGPRLESRVTADTQPRRAYVEERRAWERGLLRQMFGA
jgi:NADPH-dependent 2,4-dienoyl-CoA reductase/sulfur reductase-like enzyme